MLHACATRFDVTVNLETFWILVGTKQGLEMYSFFSETICCIHDLLRSCKGVLWFPSSLYIYWDTHLSKSVG